VKPFEGKLEDYEVTFAPAGSQAIADACGGTNGQGDVCRELRRHPLLAPHVERAHKAGRDHVHVARFDGTDLCAVWGRSSNGYHYQTGPVFKLSPKGRSDAPETP